MAHVTHVDTPYLASVCSTLSTALSHSDESEDSSIGEESARSLHDLLYLKEGVTLDRHQVIGLAYMVVKRHYHMKAGVPRGFGILSFFMGLGKTLTSLCLIVIAIRSRAELLARDVATITGPTRRAFDYNPLASARGGTNSLVLVPAALLDTWEGEFHKFMDFADKEDIITFTVARTKREVERVTTLLHESRPINDHHVLVIGHRRYFDTAMKPTLVRMWEHQERLVAKLKREGERNWRGLIDFAAEFSKRGFVYMRRDWKEMTEESTAEFIKLYGYKPSNAWMTHMSDDNWAYSSDGDGPGPKKARLKLYIRRCLNQAVRSAERPIMQEHQHNMLYSVFGRHVMDGPSFRDELAMVPWTGAVVADEVHRMQSSSSMSLRKAYMLTMGQATRDAPVGVVASSCSIASNFMGCTGTPFNNVPMDLAKLGFLCRALTSMNDVSAYNGGQCKPELLRARWTDTGNYFPHATRCQSWILYVTVPMVLSTLERSMPGVRRTKHEVAMTRRIANNYVLTLLQELTCRRVNGELMADGILAAIQKARDVSVAGVPAINDDVEVAINSPIVHKTALLIYEFLRDNPDKQLIVTSGRTTPLHAVHHLIDTHPFGGAVRVSHRGIPDESRVCTAFYTGTTKELDAFVSGDARVLLMGLRAGGVGLNLGFVDTMISMHVDYNPAADLQAECRIVRMGGSGTRHIINVELQQGFFTDIENVVSRPKQLMAHTLLEGRGEVYGRDKLNIKSICRFIQDDLAKKGLLSETELTHFDRTEAAEDVVLHV